MNESNRRDHRSERACAKVDALPSRDREGAVDEMAGPLPYGRDSEWAPGNPEPQAFACPKHPNSRMSDLLNEHTQCRDTLAANDSRGLKPAARNRCAARVSVTVLIAVIALAVGAVGGYWLPKRFGLITRMGHPAGPANGGEQTVGEDEQWYTCGMHPNVLQRGPGDCPICQMKLTPLKKESDEDSQPGTSKERKVLYWRAPMDPNYISQKPGKSPMGMDLVPVYADADESPSAHTIRIDPVTIQNMGIRTAVIQRGPLIKTIRTIGRIDYDEQLVAFVDTKFNGWIEKLYVDETGQQVRQGDPLFDVYSRELYAAQQEYLSAVQNLPRLEKSTLEAARQDAQKMVDAAVIKLTYLDVSAQQIEALKQTGTIEKTLMIHSPATGIVTEKMALEGMYVKPGMRLFTIADLSRVWVYVDIYEYQLPWIRVGQRATMNLSYVPGKEFVGKVVYVYPYLEERTRVIKVRLEFENPTMDLKPGMYATVRLESALQRDALLIPREAFIDSGTRQVAFVDLGGGKFAPRDIQVGVEAEDGKVEVLDGLDEGEVVVTSGQFMLDAESKLKEAVAKMMEAERTKTTKRVPASRTPRAASFSLREATDEMGAPTASVPAEESRAIPADARYACPMETHPDEPDPADQGPYFSAEPGKCPRCGMKLKPIEEFPWVEKYRPEHAASTGAVASTGDGIPANAKYACPMDRHPDERDPENQGPYFSEQPGTCPRCGMKLKPIDDLDWVRVRRAAQGGDVAYTCPDHPHVFSETEGTCPRCGKALKPFKVMYTCPDPKHADVVSTHAGNCPECGRGMAAFRGVWLDATMAEANVPPDTGPADVAAYHCPIHPLVHSDHEGRCTICGAKLVATGIAKAAEAAERPIPADAKYVCAMRQCWHFSEKPGACPKCGMKLKPIDQVAWAKEAIAAASTASTRATVGRGAVESEVSDVVRPRRLKPAAQGDYVCPMHPEQVHAAQPGTCPICGMQLVARSALKQPKAPPEHIAAQMNYIMEHYLGVQRLLASDRTAELALHALGLVSASEALRQHLHDPGVTLPPEFAAAAEKLRTSALRITGRLASDRVVFVDLSAAVRTLVENARPDPTRWPKLYLYHCPMSKGDWFQTSETKANPYYGFKMLQCGELKGIR